MSTTTAVVAYSGGLDTSCIVAWLKEEYGFDEVVAERSWPSLASRISARPFQTRTCARRSEQTFNGS